MNPSLLAIFNQSAMEAQKAFPEILDSLLVLSTTSDRPVYVAADIAQEVSRQPVLVKAMVNEARVLMEQGGFGALASRGADFGDRLVQRLIMTDAVAEPFVTADFTQEMNQIWNFDHEMGHLVVMSGMPVQGFSVHRAECAADAYAALRHVQRFGTKTGYDVQYSHAPGIILQGEGAHYTDAVIERVAQVTRERDISGLTISQTADLAEEIAQECEEAQATLDKIREAFLPARAEYDAAGKLCDAVVVRMTDILDDYRGDPDIYRAGKRFLNMAFMKNTIAEKAAADPHWERLQKTIEKTLAVSEKALPRAKPSPFKR